MNEEELEIYKTTPEYKGYIFFRKKFIEGICVDDLYIDVSKPMCQEQYPHKETRMIKPMREFYRDTSKYPPHQGEKERNRRMQRND